MTTRTPETPSQTRPTELEEPGPPSSFHKALWVILGIDLAVLIGVWLTVPVLGIFPGAVAVILLVVLGITHAVEAMRAKHHPGA